MNNKDLYLEKIADKEKALEIALRTREFEIELYWKRTTYFSIIVGALFVGYYTVRDSTEIYKPLISLMGALISLGWLLANKGSKYWQENWEHHVEALEDYGVGPIFGTILERPEPRHCISHFWLFLMGPGRYSVSSINTLISLFVIVSWIYLFFTSLNLGMEFPRSIDTMALLYITALMFGVALLLWRGRSSHLHKSRFKMPGRSSGE
ncbi:hypothetical protein ABRY95_12305 [Castellaniella ginsengisoli]|uniref:DUF2157 domain-containing protein n=1 Tax=Castellaniella ginsengisoli TaxID=546114 RepID=A0AB39G9A7_9BURK